MIYAYKVMDYVTVNGKTGQVMGVPFDPKPLEPAYIVRYKPDNVNAVEEIFTEDKIS
jgi:hypothetical protein